MPYVFTPPQQVQIEALYQAGPLENQPGDFVDMYSYIATVLSAGNPPPDSAPEVLQSRLWFDGAVRANSDEGVFAILIREYTQTQGKLHYGEKFRNGVGEDGMQEASNNVARAVHDDIAQSGWTTPTIKDIADEDASAVGQTLFSRNDQDTASTQNAAWAGAVLYSLLGGDQTWRWIGPETAQVVDTFDDYRNLVFARLAWDTTLTSAIVYSPYEAIRDDVMSGMVEDMKVFAETCWMSGSFFKTGCSPTFQAMIKGTAAETAFAAAGMNLSSARTLALLASGYNGEIVVPGAAGDLGAAFRFFRPIGIAGQAASTTVLTPANLYAQAQGTGASADEAKQALVALSPFVIAGGGSPSAGTAYLTLEYLADRRDMVAARLAFDAAELGYDETLSDYSVLRGAIYTDIEPGIPSPLTIRCLVPLERPLSQPRHALPALPPSATRWRCAS